MSRSKKIDFLVLVLLIFPVVPLILYFNLKFLPSAFLFMGVPSIFLIIRRTQNLKSVFFGIFFIGIILGFLFDFLATFNNAWYIPDNQLTFPYRVLGFAPVDELLVLILWTGLIMLVYEHFCERKQVEHLQFKKYLYHAIAPSLLAFLVIICMFYLHPSVISFKYSYLILGLITAWPFLYVLYKKPKLLKRILMPAPYFFLVFFVYELIAVYLGQWYFNGEYIGHVQFFSQRFPIEEFILWIMVGSVIVLADYKLFVDTEK